ncbi:hypothetical protein [Idiomarina xiamenensis]|uniref:Uncharacterized protein n=1 Tax=Idiomarina xiamenensis 10-D-4 TaxID=740709 RepID=K2JLW7_9GAMM|nr:hypothetical protein [Idiomarina xiamenensis]EKE84501.1 hypothetical protein A10D4_05517 [Idiomarina xiamenensis 10-D-4]
MALATPAAYVKQADADFVRVLCYDETVRDSLRKLGFSPQHDAANNHAIAYQKATHGRADKARLLRLLRDLDIPFMGGHGWSPAEVFSYLREQPELLSGDFREVSWSSPRRYRIRQR